MGDTNMTTLPAEVKIGSRAINCIVEYNTPGTDTMMNGTTPYIEDQWHGIPYCICERITDRIGPEPSDAVINIPFGQIPTPGAPGLDVAGISLISSGWKPWQTSGYRGGAAPFTPEINIRLWSKIRIFPIIPGAQEALKGYEYRKQLRMFIGYVSNIEWAGKEKVYTGIRITVLDARVFLKYTPVQGALYYNPEVQKYVYIRDHDIAFNENKKPNKLRWKDESNERNHSKPAFIWTDYNRFPSGTGNPARDHIYVHDQWITEQDPSIWPYIGDPLAVKWLPGDAWNYIRNTCDYKLMRAATGRQYDNPVAPIPEDECPPLRDCELKIATMTPSTVDTRMWYDFFRPRAYTGSTSQNGFADLASGLGDFNPTGLPMNEVLFEICRRVGNYSIGVVFNNDDTTSLIPFRTCQAYGDGTAPVGKRGGKKAMPNVKLPDDNVPHLTGDTKMPNVHTWVMKSGTESYYNRIHYMAGRRWIQVVFSTAGQKIWTDDLGQSHVKYDNPANQWGPHLDGPTLVPGWTAADQQTFVEEWNHNFQNGEHAMAIDAFSTWIVPQTGPKKIDWVEFFNSRFSKTPDFGFRRFFERDRQLAEHLAAQIFDPNLGVFRRRRQRFPAIVARSFKGVKLAVDEVLIKGGTAYGDWTTVGKPIEGFQDWYLGWNLIDYEVVNDGRLGFKLGPEARWNKNFRFENQKDGKPLWASATRSPWSWNGVVDMPLSYEMLFITMVEIDENLWEQIVVPDKGKVRRIDIHGPVLEKYRHAGNEYGEERAIHSLVPWKEHIGPNKFLETPQVTASGKDDIEDRVYIHDIAEVQARVRMDANRHAMPDEDYMLDLDEIYLGFEAGDYIPFLQRMGYGGTEGGRIWTNAIIESITHDFLQNQSSIHLASIR